MFWTGLLLCLQLKLAASCDSNENVSTTLINPNGYVEFGTNYMSYSRIYLNESTKPITKFSVCLWINPFRFRDSCKILSVKDWDSDEYIFTLKMDKENVVIEDFTSEKKIPTKPKEWQHLCILYDGKFSIHFNKITYQFNSINADQAIEINSDIEIAVGALDQMEYSFSGMVADIRLYFNVVSKSEAEEISKFINVTTEYISVKFEYDPDTHREIPSNFYIDTQVINNVPISITQCEITSSPLDNFIANFNLKTDCNSAVDICGKFGGHLPARNNDLDTLFNMISLYISNVNTAVKSFWMLKSIDKPNDCLKGLYNEKKQKLEIFSTVSPKLSVVCILSKDQVYYLKNDEKVTEFHYIPNSNFIFEAFNDGTRIIWKEKVATRIGLESNIDLDKTSLKADSSLLGRKMWNGYGLEQTKKIFSICSTGQFTCSSGNCIDFDKVCDFNIDCSDVSDEEFCEVGISPEEFGAYEKRLAPVVDVNSKTKVTLHTSLKRVVDIDVKGNTITINLQVHAEWTDLRLKFKNLQDNQTAYVNDKVSKQIWHPRIVLKGTIYDDKYKFKLDTNHGSLSALKLKPAEVKIFKGYKVTLNQGNDVLLIHQKTENIKLTCNMDLYFFPFDSQSCNFSMVLQGIIRPDVEWGGNMKAEIQEGEENLVLYSDLGFNIERSPETSDTAIVTMFVKRKFGAYIFNTFLPCIALELIGLFTLLIPCEDYADRANVTLACLIVMAAFFTQISSSLPSSADPKLIDIWMFVHVCILFLVFVVHIGVIRLFLKHEKDNEQQDRESSSKLFLKNKIHLGYEMNFEKKKEKEKRPSYDTFNIVGSTICYLCYALFLILYFSLILA